MHSGAPVGREDSRAEGRSGRALADTICEVAGADARDVEIIFYDKKPSDWSRDGRLF